MDTSPQSHRWRTLRLLTRHFFRRFLENDLVSPNGDSHAGLSYVIGGLVSPGLLLASTYVFKYSMWRPEWEDVALRIPGDAMLFVALSMIATGLAATVTWDAFFLESRDYQILGVLPIAPWEVKAAKLASLGAFIGVLVVALGIVPTLLVPALMMQGLSFREGAAHFLPLTMAQGAAVALSGAWTVLAVVSLRALLSVCLPRALFRLASPFVQAALTLVFLSWFMWMPATLSVTRALIQQGAIGIWMPPAWFLGLHQWIIGRPDPIHRELAVAGLKATLLLLVIVVAVFPLVPISGAVAAARRSWVAAAWSRVRRLAALLLVRHAEGRGSFAFTLWALNRSAVHRLYVAASLGAAAALAASLVLLTTSEGRGFGALRVPVTATLQVQGVLILFLAAALRFGAMVPVVLRGNWLFRVTEGERTTAYLRGARAAALLITLVPVVLLLPAHAFLWGLELALHHALVGVLLAAGTVGLLFKDLAAVPCTATYVPGQLKLKSRAPLFAGAIWLITWPPARIEQAALQQQLAWWFLPALMLAGILLLALWRWRGMRSLTGLAFDEPPEDAVQTLGLVE